MEPALQACRFVQFTAAVVLFGGIAFRFYALSNNAVLAGTLAAFDCWLRVMLRASAIAALASALALLLCQTAAMAGTPAAATDLATVSAVVFETRFGRVWSWHLLIALVLVPVCFDEPGRRQPLVLILSLLLLGSLGWIGHPAMAEGAARLAQGLNTTVHLLAIGLWLGGLPALGWVLRRARAAPDAGDAMELREAVRHFSQMGYIAVALVALTGAVNSLLLVGSFRAMLDTPYGRLLCLKIFLFLGMVALALINRFRLAPRISRDPSALRALCRTVGAEQALGICILAVVSILGTWPPAVHGG
jgi:putative copper resistance protein D